MNSHDETITSDPAPTGEVFTSLAPDGSNPKRRSRSNIAKLPIILIRVYTRAVVSLSSTAGCGLKAFAEFELGKCPGLWQKQATQCSREQTHFDRNQPERSISFGSVARGSFSFLAEPF